MTNLLRFQIKGMRCVTCATRVEKAIASVDGVKAAKVNFVNEKATAQVDSTEPILVKNIENAIHDEGYKGVYVSEKSPAHDKHQNHMHHGIAPEYRDLLIAVLFTLPLLLHMFGVYIPPLIQWILASVVQFWAGRHFTPTLGIH